MQHLNSYSLIDSDSNNNNNIEITDKYKYIYISYELMTNLPIAKGYLLSSPPIPTILPTSNPSTTYPPLEVNPGHIILAPVITRPIAPASTIIIGII
jgi:hypothetical protein